MCVRSSNRLNNDQKIVMALTFVATMALYRKYEHPRNFLICSTANSQNPGGVAFRRKNLFAALGAWLLPPGQPIIG
jgi:hypothetical protein